DTALGNALAGIGVDAAGTATAGSGVQGSGNVISANFDGVVLAPGTTGISVKGNLVGTNATGTAALGNVAAGVRIDHAVSNTIGGIALHAGNVISGNGDGVGISG